MQVIISLIIGYLMGCISPAAIISKIKNVNLKETGTRNLDATNTTLVLGKRAGVVVLVVDIMKSILSAKLVKLLFPHAVCAGMIACIGCILGHCFPVFLGFQGGKGLAAFAGMVLEYNPWFTIPIVIPGVILVLILNTGVAAPMLGCVVFPILVACSREGVQEIVLALLASFIIVYTHRDNLKKALMKADIVSARDFLLKITR